MLRGVTLIKWGIVWGGIIGDYRWFFMIRLEADGRWPSCGVTLGYLTEGVSFICFRSRDMDFTKDWGQAFCGVEESD